MRSTNLVAARKEMNAARKKYCNACKDVLWRKKVIVPSFDVIAHRNALEFAEIKRDAALADLSDCCRRVEFLLSGRGRAIRSSEVSCANH